ncbi:MAG: alpha/beta hydrolase [Planctomycetota bacterium]|nr:MAG: alpha/beta hydrolase [Planctomycetota bacterium]
MRALSFLLFLSLSAVLSAADPTLVIDVWPGAAPGEPSGIGPETAETKPGENPPTTRVGNVTKPTLSVFRPAPDKASGTAIIICPGGGYNILAWDKEGTEIAEWLNTLGVTGIVLKYRVPRRPDAPKDQHPMAALQDAQRAIRLVRSRAAEWKLDEKKIGILGFSAGGHLAAWASTHHNTVDYPEIDAIDKLSGRPDFTCLIYPAYLVTKDQTALTPQMPVTAETPPMFLVHAYDDGVTADSSVQMFLALKRNKVSAELHVYSKGGHGYGMRPGPNVVVTWPKRCEEWLRASQWVP